MNSVVLATVWNSRATHLRIGQHTSSWKSEFEFSRNDCMFFWMRSAYPGCGFETILFIAWEYATRAVKIYMYLWQCSLYATHPSIYIYKRQYLPEQVILWVKEGTQVQRGHKATKTLFPSCSKSIPVV